MGEESAGWLTAQNSPGRVLQSAGCLSSFHFSKAKWRLQSLPLLPGIWGIE